MREGEHELDVGSLAESSRVKLDELSARDRATQTQVESL
jgi:hypothetical protein